MRVLIYIVHIFCFSQLISATNYGLGKITQRPQQRVWFDVENSTSSYYFAPNLRMNILGAREHCRKQNATLVSIHSLEENQLVLNITAKARGYYTVDKVWLGIRRDAGNSSKTHWMDGTRLGYSNWTNNSSEHDSYCAYMIVNPYSRFKGQWNHSNCAEELQFMCTNTTEKAFNESLATDIGECDDGWIRHMNTCYMISSNAQAFEAASKTCRQRWAADLVAVSSQDEQNFLTALLAYKNYTTLWLGGRKKPGAYKYFWTSNLPFRYRNWKTGHPKYYSKQACMRIILNTTDEFGEWEDVNCTLQLRYICEKSTNVLNVEPSETVFPLPCAKREDYLNFGDACYKMYNHTLDWLHAEEVCKSDGGNLVSISDKFQQAFLLSLMQKHNLSTVWIGLKSVMQGHMPIRWTDNTALYYVNFGFQKKTNESQCAYLQTSGVWASEPQCNRSRTFVCKIHKEAAYMNEGQNAAHCPAVNSKFIQEGASWVDLDPKLDSCYFISHSNNLADAYLDCSLRDGSVASIHNEHQLKLLAAFTAIVTRSNTNNFILGLYSTPGGSFQWLDRTPVDFTSWKVDEPRNRSRYAERKCVYASSNLRKWRTASCGYNRGVYICSVRKVSAVATSGEAHTGHIESRSSARIFVPLLSCGMLLLFMVYKFYRQKQSVKSMPENASFYHTRLLPE